MPSEDIFMIGAHFASPSSIIGCLIFESARSQTNLLIATIKVVPFRGFENISGSQNDIKLIIYIYKRFPLNVSIQEISFSRREIKGYHLK